MPASEPTYLTVRELIRELRRMPMGMHVTAPMLAKDDIDSIIAQGDVRGVDTNGDCVVLFVMDGYTAPVEG
jgi:hypothetical protein